MYARCTGMCGVPPKLLNSTGGVVVVLRNAQAMKERLRRLDERETREDVNGDFALRHVCATGYYRY